MSWRDKAVRDAQERLSQAQRTAEVVAAQGDRVEDRLSLIERLAEGWRVVHEENHLAQLFDEEWSKTR